MDKRMLKSWLESGALDMATKEEIATMSGVSQGGPISPTLANMVLDGLQDHVKDAVAHLHDDRTRKRRKTFSPKVNVV